MGVRFVFMRSTAMAVLLFVYNSLIRNNDKLSEQTQIFGGEVLVTHISTQYAPGIHTCHWI
jgi:hypothetical protein